MGNYISITDISNWGSETDSQKNEIVRQAESTIERITKDYFYPKPFIVKIDGNGRDRIYMPFIQDIVDISEIKIDTSEISGYSWNEYSIKSDWDDIIGEVTNIFTKGKNNIQIIGRKGWAEKIEISAANGTFEIGETITGGTSAKTAKVYEIYNDILIIINKSGEFTVGETITGSNSATTATTTIITNNTPLNIKKACIKLCEYTNDNTLYETYSPQMESEKLGDYSYRKANNKYFTGITEVDSLLMNYILKRGRFGVI